MKAKIRLSRKMFPEQQFQMIERTVLALALLLANAHGYESRVAPVEQSVQTMAPGEQTVQLVEAVLQTSVVVVASNR